MSVWLGDIQFNHVDGVDRNPILRSLLFGAIIVTLLVTLEDYLINRGNTFREPDQVKSRKRTARLVAIFMVAFYGLFVIQLGNGMLNTEQDTTGKLLIGFGMLFLFAAVFGKTEAKSKRAIKD